MNLGELKQSQNRYIDEASSRYIMHTSAVAVDDESQGRCQEDGDDLANS